MLTLEQQDNEYTQIVVRHNASMTPTQRNGLVLTFALWFVVLFTVGTALNGWPVIVFAFIVIMAVTLSFQYSLRQSGYLERITWQPHQLIWELTKPGQPTERNTFVPRWIKLKPIYAANGDCAQLKLQIHGKSLVIAEQATYEERDQLYQFLKMRTGADLH